MNRMGPLSRLAALVAMANVWLTVLLLPASCLGIGWVMTTLVLIFGPLGVLTGIIAWQRERDPRSHEAALRAITISGVAVLVHLAKLAFLGPFAMLAA